MFVTESHSDAEERVSIGKIHRAVGLDGAVEAELYSGDPARLPPETQVFAGDHLLKVTTSRPGRRGSVTLYFEGVHDRTGAEALRGLEIEVPTASLPQAAEGSYYHFELIGCMVQDLEGHTLGTVSGIMETGANDVYVVERPDGAELLVPAVKAVIKNIDTSGRIITIDPPHGLIE